VGAARQPHRSAAGTVDAALDRGSVVEHAGKVAGRTGERARRLPSSRVSILLDRMPAWAEAHQCLAELALVDQALAMTPAQ
jgi:hypothetical protein